MWIHDVPEGTPEEVTGRLEINPEEIALDEGEKLQLLNAASRARELVGQLKPDATVAVHMRGKAATEFDGAEILVHAYELSGPEVSKPSTALPPAEQEGPPPLPPLDDRIKACELALADPGLSDEARSTAETLLAELKAA